MLKKHPRIANLLAMTVTTVGTATPLLLPAIPPPYNLIVAVAFAAGSTLYQRLRANHHATT